MNKRFAAYSPQNDKKLVIYAESLKAAHAKAGKNKWFTDVSYNTQLAHHSPKKMLGVDMGKRSSLSGKLQKSKHEVK